MSRVGILADHALDDGQHTVGGEAGLGQRGLGIPAVVPRLEDDLQHGGERPGVGQQHLGLDRLGLHQQRRQRVLVDEQRAGLGQPLPAHGQVQELVAGELQVGVLRLVELALVGARLEQRAQHLVLLARGLVLDDGAAQVALDVPAAGLGVGGHRLGAGAGRLPRPGVPIQPALDDDGAAADGAVVGGLLLGQLHVRHQHPGGTGRLQVGQPAAVAQTPPPSRRLGDGDLQVGWHQLALRGRAVGQHHHRVDDERPGRRTVPAPHGAADPGQLPLHALGRPDRQPAPRPVLVQEGAGLADAGAALEHDVERIPRRRAPARGASARAPRPRPAPVWAWRPPGPPWARPSASGCAAWRTCGSCRAPWRRRPRGARSGCRAGA